MSSKRRGKPARLRLPIESVVVSAAEIVAALGADKLAVVASELVAASGTYLAVMIDGLCGSGSHGEFIAG